MSSFDETIARRRQLLKWMSASPLLAMPGVASLAAENPVYAPNRLPDPVMSAPRILMNAKTMMNT